MLYPTRLDPVSGLPKTSFVRINHGVIMAATTANISIAGRSLINIFLPKFQRSTTSPATTVKATISMAERDITAMPNPKPANSHSRVWFDLRARNVNRIPKVTPNPANKSPDT